MAMPEFVDLGTALSAFLLAATTYIGLRVRKMSRREVVYDDAPAAHALMTIRESIDRIEAELENLAKEQPEIRAKLREVRHEMFNELQLHIARIELAARDLEKRVRYAELDLARLGVPKPPHR